MAMPRTIILITGANQGLGFECVKKLAAEQASYHILLGSRNASKGEAAANKVTSLADNTTITSIELDVDSDSSISAAVTTITNTYGRLDVLFNNAGILEPPKKCSAREAWVSVFSTNVFYAYLLSEAMIPLLQKSDFPRIIFMGSTLGSITKAIDADTSWGRVLPVYSSSKSALNMVAAKLNGQYRRAGFKVNVVCPGHRSTNLNAYTPKGGKAEDGALEVCRICQF